MRRFLLALILGQLGLLGSGGGGMSTSSAGSGVLLFKSGFESATVLQAASGIIAAGMSDQRYTTGIDASTSYNWSTFWGLFGQDPGLNGDLLIPGDGQSAGTTNYATVFTSAIDSTNAHTGSQSLKFNVLGPTTGFSNPNCNPDCGQESFTMENFTNGLNVNGQSSVALAQYYQRVWMFFPTAMNTQAQGQASWWRSFMEFKSGCGTDPCTKGHRFVVYVYRNSGVNSNNLYWHFAEDDLTDHYAGGCAPIPTPCTFWQADNFTTAVPVNSWFMLEWYFKLTSGSDGRFFVSLYDGVSNHVLVDQTVAQGTTTGGNFAPALSPPTTNEHLETIFPMNVYGSMWPSTHSIDDIQVWTAPPCATLPCGP